MKQVSCGSCEYRWRTRQYLQKKEPCRCNHNLYNCFFFFVQRGNKLNRINYFMLDERKKLSQVWIDIVVLTGHNDLAHLAYLAPVVQKMDNCIHSTNLYPVDSAIDYLILTYWIVIYPSDSAFQRLRNGRLYFIFIYCLHNLTAWHRSSVRLLQAAITVIFFPYKRKFYWKGKKSTNKECCIAVAAGLLRKQTYQTNILN